MYGQPQMAYRDAEVMSSSPERLVPLLYERLLVSLKRGALSIQNQDIEGKHEQLQRAVDIVYELLGSLDFEQGGEIAQRLASLYTFWSKEISQAGRALQADRIQRVAAMVAELHESWVEAVRVVETDSPLPRAGGETG